ncbi:MAG: cadherin domain-containing protein [Kiloniellales bacterium]|nr:cadherin domain-containing protein [Kiloniellales bacterium]
MPKGSVVVNGHVVGRDASAEPAELIVQVGDALEFQGVEIVETRIEDEDLLLTLEDGWTVRIPDIVSADNWLSSAQETLAGVLSPERLQSHGSIFGEDNLLALSQNSFDFLTQLLSQPLAVSSPQIGVEGRRSQALAPESPQIESAEIPQRAIAPDNGPAKNPATGLQGDPLTLALGNSSVAENSAAGAVVGTLSATAPDGGPVTFGLQNDPSGFFEVVGNELRVASGAAFDFETAQSHDVILRVTDSAGNSFDQTLTIAVTNINDVAPSITSAATQSATENITVPVLTVTAVDPDTVGGPVMFAITGNGADDALFTIDSDTGDLSFRNAPDFETPLDANSDNTYEVEVTASDGTNSSPPQTISVTVTDENEAPKIAYTPRVISTTEAQDTSSRIKVGDIQINDDALSGPNGNQLSLSGNDAGLFEIDGTELFLVQGAMLDFETNPILNVQIAVDDDAVGVTPDDFVDVAIAITDVLDVLELSDLDGTNGFVLNGIDTFDRSGVSVSSAGDVNGDGIDDLIIGAFLADPNGNDNAGESYVVYGGQDFSSGAFELSSLDGSNGFVLNGIDAGDLSGFSVSSAGDVNGDGIDDLIIGADGGDANGVVSGESYVVFGGQAFGASFELSSLDGSNGFVLNGIDARDRSGNSVSSAGDVNGDGIGDLIIGASIAGPIPFTSFIGESYVVFGGQDFSSGAFELSSLDGSNGFVLNGIDNRDFSGISVSSAGDVNGDGIDDLIIGATGGDPNGSYSGESYVVFGDNFTGGVTLGGDGNNLLTGAVGAGDQLVGGLGNDTLVGNGGADALSGGQGDDVLAVSDASFLSVRGGGGSDSLRLDGGLDLDLTQIANNRIQDIEIIDLLSDASANALTLDLEDILDLTNANNALKVLGDAADSLNLSPLPVGHPAAGGDWTRGANMGDFTVFTFDVGADTIATLQVDSDISVTGFV